MLKFNIETEFNDCLHELFPLHDSVTNVLFISRPTSTGLWVELFSTYKVDQEWIRKCTDYSRMTCKENSKRYRITFDEKGEAMITRISSEDCETTPYKVIYDAKGNAIITLKSIKPL